MNPRVLIPPEAVRAAERPSRHAPDAVSDALERFGHRAPSALADHGKECCRAARGWFRAMAVAAAAQFPGPPAWIRQRWEWGPNDWPLHWCQVPRLRTLDCGALAGLARASFRAVGLDALPVQMLERFDAGAVEHWRAAWRSHPSCPPWTHGFIAYHEAVALLAPDGSVALWDPTDSRFVHPPAAGPGYGSALALRIVDAQDGGNGSGGGNGGGRGGAPAAMGDPAVAGGSAAVHRSDGTDQPDRTDQWDLSGPSGLSGLSDLSDCPDLPAVLAAANAAAGKGGEPPAWVWNGVALRLNRWIRL